MRKALVIMGTRPEAIKMAPVIHALKLAPDYDPIVVSTGQHRDMLAPVIERFNIEIDHSLDVMQPDQTLTSLTARLLDGIGPVLQDEAPDITLVQGDTTSMLSGTLASFYQGIPVAHIEAGLRTGEMRAPFPEEANRVLASRLAHLHFAPTPRSRDQLIHEHIPPETISVTGNTVIDALHMELDQQRIPQEKAKIDDSLTQHLGAHWRSRPFVLITGHRRESFGSGFEDICNAIKTLADQFPDTHFLYPVHLNPRVREPVERILTHSKNIQLIEPVGYGLFVALLDACQLILTDSGGVQEEAPSLGKPVLVMRETTERPEGIDAGTVKLVGTTYQNIVNQVSQLLSNREAYAEMASAQNPYGDGQASARILEGLQDFFDGKIPRVW